MKGYVQVYTGDGKGKTSAALGLVVRACGAGLRVYMGQFIKRGLYSEIRTLRDRFPDVRVEQYGRGRFIRGRPDERDVQAARSGYEKLLQAIRGGNYDLVIADEIGSAVTSGILEEEDVLALLKERPAHVELVLTGRGVGRRVKARADLVTEMRNVKHYGDAGVKARKGIEM